jgi:hypothetical protein
MRSIKIMLSFLLGAGMAFLPLASLSLASEVRDNIYFVAGDMAEPEDYYGDIAVIKGYGYGSLGSSSTIVRAGGEKRWFNIPIITPTNIENTDVSLNEVYLLFESHRKVIVERIELYDGFDLISVNLPTFNLTFSTQTYRYITVGPENTFSFQTPHKMKSALNIRVLVNFENAQFDFNNFEYMDFVGAGARFRRSW